jgi:hypothetical protein
MTPLFGMFSVSCKTSGSSADASIECSHAWLAYLFFLSMECQRHILRKRIVKITKLLVVPNTCQS